MTVHFALQCRGNSDPHLLVSTPTYIPVLFVPYYSGILGVAISDAIGSIITVGDTVQSQQLGQ